MAVIQAVRMWHCVDVTPAMNALENCTNAKRTRQVFTMKKNYGFQIFCVWCHKWSTFRPL